MNAKIKRYYPASYILICLFLYITCAQGSESSSGEGVVKSSMTASSVDVMAMFDSVRLNEKVSISGLYLDGEVSPIVITLKRVDVFSPDSKIIVIDKSNNQYMEPPPANAYYRGTIDGSDDSLVALTVEPSGKMRGLIEITGERWKVKQDIDPSNAAMPRTSVGLSSSKLSKENEATEEQGESFACESKDEPPFSIPKNIVDPSTLKGVPFDETIMASPLSLTAGEFFEVPVAVETDYEYYSLFNNSSSAATYIGDLFNYASAIYQRDVNATFMITTTYIYEANNDPWNSALTDTGQRLTEFRNYWNSNRSAVDRASAVFLSGRGPMSGLADSYVYSNGVYYAPLCWKSQGYGYAYIGGINRGFNPGAPSPGWDIVAAAHEVGHNFGSPHTHMYAGLGGNSNPVDYCFYPDPPTGTPTGQLPGIGSLSGGTPGTGVGTIMSYCHLNSPGMSNISFKFGKDHPYGIQAYRVTNLMSERMQNSANMFPNCLKVIGGGSTYQLTVQKSGTGSGTVTGSGINCGSDCSESYTSGTSVTLTAAAASGSTFASWSGCTTTSGATCYVTMNAAKTVTATFDASTPNTYPLTVQKSGTGTGTVTGSGISCGSDCSESFTSGTSVTLTAAAASGSTFGSWSGCTTTSGATCYVTMNATKTVTATFTVNTPNTYPLTVQKSGTGTGTVTGSGISCGGDCSESYTSGTQVTLTAAAANGSTFAGWSGCSTTSGATCYVTMNAAKTVTATFNLSGGTVTGLLSAILPSARSVTVGTAATAFGTIINATGVAVTGCYLALPNSPYIPANFTYQTTNASNQLTGTANTPVNIPIGGIQGFVFGITPSAPFNATDIPIVFDCANTVPAPSQTGLNTFLLSASATPVPDMVAIGATPSKDGVLRIPGPTGVHAFGTAAVNIGAGGTITVTADTGGKSLPLTLTLCQTNPSTGACMATPAASVSSWVGNQQVATYAVFAQAKAAIEFDPAVNRIFLRLASSGVVRGATSVAVMTEATANLPDFVIQSISLANTPNYPGYFDATIKVANNGTLADYPRILRLWLNQGANQACGIPGDYAGNIDSVGGTPTKLQPGWVRTVTITKLPVGSVGAKTFRAYVDANCETKESNENNNQGTRGYNVTQAATASHIEIQ